MGAKVTISGKAAYIEGVPELHGAPVMATDLRGGAALVIAGLMAHGVTRGIQPGYIARGYEHLESKLSALGADIGRESGRISWMQKGSHLNAFDVFGPER